VTKRRFSHFFGKNHEAFGDPGRLLFGIQKGKQKRTGLVLFCGGAAFVVYQFYPLSIGPQYCPSISRPVLFSFPECPRCCQRGFSLSEKHESPQQFAQTLSHELMHLLNLNHRCEKNDPIPDLLPENARNMMFWGNIVPLSQDLDLIQLRGARGSKILVD
jgi:hypothetical protein